MEREKNWEIDGNQNVYMFVEMSGRTTFITMMIS